MTGTSRTTWPRSSVAKWVANRTGSMVADVTTTLRSGLRGSSCLR